MNVTEDEFKRYIEVFHSTLKDTANKFLAHDVQKKILHLSLLPAKIIGYVSTQYGVAIEYKPSDKTIISTRRGSARVEDLFFTAPRSLKKMAPFIRNSGKNTLFHSCSFSGKFPFRLAGTDSSIFLYKVNFDAQNWQQFVNYAEVYADRSKDFWSIENAISKAKDEVLSALVESNRAIKRSVSIDEYIAKYKKKAILVLGDYGKDGLRRLEVISKNLEEMGYEPLMVKDIPDNVYHDLSQKVVAIGSIARFIIVDDSSKSGHLMEIDLCRLNNWITILLRTEDANGSWMSAGVSEHSKNILEKSYDANNPKTTITEAIAWAEDRLNELKNRFSDIYPWRISTANKADLADKKIRSAE